ncbi:macrophage receptor MARCO isoform X2 [Girardinichthys multiradiatus]|uniref:macrophage receptor MARCO isoform X2 n=1 Tax=Girardinichthys multiradiatus TaxID=208333 RepID=UPI001FAD2913|nr:macrophage receptor MARCO isoform X2 [Girardinichthys multiradiatus]
METAVDETMDQVTYYNPLFDISLNRSDRYNFQHDDLKPARSRRQWSFIVIIIYVILHTALDVFLIYKANPASQKKTSDHSFLGDSNLDLNLLIHNNSRETKNLKSQLLVLQNQVKRLCGEEGQLQRLSAELDLLNTSNHNLENKLTTITLKTGPPGPAGTKGLPGQQGPKGERGPKGDSGRPGLRGETGLKGGKGEPGAAGEVGPRGPAGNQGTPGRKGEQGEPGAKGLSGERGDSGMSGEKGQAGKPGLKGEKGDPGSIGPQGPPGARGPTGFNGTQGPPGLQGLKGEKGETGKHLNVRLVPGKNKGRVEVMYNNVWGTICDDNFSTLEGRVICKMLGFKTVVSTFTATPGSGKIWLDELQCTGAESDIFDCPHTQVGVHNCNHDEDAGVYCM